MQPALGLGIFPLGPRTLPKTVGGVISGEVYMLLLLVLIVIFRGMRVLRLSQCNLVRHLTAVKNLATIPTYLAILASLVKTASFK